MTIFERIFERTAEAISQFGLLRGLFFVTQAALLRIVDSRLIRSYSQFGEDRILAQFLHGIERGYYVEVGCNDPIRYSNTWSLYRRGWSGLVVDANEECIQRFHRVRPRDTAVCAVVSDVEREVDFYRCSDSLLSGISATAGGPLASTSSNGTVEKRQAVRLDTLVAHHMKCEKVHLLIVDVEGHDLEVLRSVDLAGMRPLMIVVEMHGFEINNSYNSSVYEHLLKNHYQLKAFDGINGYYMWNGK